MIRPTSWICGFAVIAMSAASASAQAPHAWHTGTALAVFGGAASSDGARHGAAGAAIGWELTPYLTIEGSGTWIDNPDARLFAALLGSRVNVIGRRSVVPFVEGAVGVQNASVDVASGRAPSFFDGRVAAGGGTVGARQSFDDLAWTFGGGVDLFVNHHVAVRPDVRVLAVHAPGRTDTSLLFGVHLAYHFENHVVTPSRR